jgi:hypothetical protein
MAMVTACPARSCADELLPINKLTSNTPSGNFKLVVLFRVTLQSRLVPF